MHMNISKPMSRSKSIFLAVTQVVSVVAILLNVFVYFYPNIVNSANQCQWHNTSVKSRYAVLNLLIPHMPWLETALLNFPRLQALKTRKAYENGVVSDINMLVFGDPQINGNWDTTPYIKRLDNYGNDYYLGHVYDVMKRRLQPSHVAVMGDQFSSQWIPDSEFYNRTRRFVERLFPRDLSYKKTVLDTWKKHEDYDWFKWSEAEEAMDAITRYESRSYHDMYDWHFPENQQPNYENPLFINLTGNHDVGYSGDATWQHMARFHLLFGQNNYVINYNEGEPEEWRLVVLDSLSLEGPALQEEFRAYTWSFLENLEKSNENFKGSTILLTHIPFFKKTGLCADGPEHVYYENYKKEPYKNGKLRSQNHLLHETTQKVLNIVFPNAHKEGIILTGHDHVGCDSWYNYIDDEWIASHEKQSNEHKPIREVVVRSMMGEFEGQTGLVTGQYDYQNEVWNFEFTYCSFVVQHVWWASKVSLFLAILLSSIYFLRKQRGGSRGPKIPF